MTKIKLGINTCFAINRWWEPEVWLKIVRKDLGLKHVQFCFDLLDPIIVDKPIGIRVLKKIKDIADSYGIRFDTCSTGEVPHRFNLLMHPYPDIRSCYLRWYEQLIVMSTYLGADGAGVYMGSMTNRDLNDTRRKEHIINCLLENLQCLANVAKNEDQKFLMWEPMSIPREIPCTISEAKELHRKVNEGTTLPILFCLDFGHGYVASEDPRDGDPYVWLKEFAHISPSIHIQQTDKLFSRHWPFTKDYNKQGIIEAPKVIEAIEDSGAEEVILVLELFHSGQAPTESRVLDDLKESVEYWSKYISL